MKTFTIYSVKETAHGIKQFDKFNHKDKKKFGANEKISKPRITYITKKNTKHKILSGNLDG